MVGTRLVWPLHQNHGSHTDTKNHNYITHTQAHLRCAHLKLTRNKEKEIHYRSGFHGLGKGDFRKQVYKMLQEAELTKTSSGYLQLTFTHSCQYECHNIELTNNGQTA